VTLEVLVVVVVESEDDVVDLVLVFDSEELVVSVVVFEDELSLCVVVVVECAEVVEPWLLESLAIVVVVVEEVTDPVDVEERFGEVDAVEFVLPFVVPPLAPPAARFLRLAEVIPAAIKTTTIPTNSSVADLFNLCLKIPIVLARKIAIANILSLNLTLFGHRSGLNLQAKNHTVAT
jgi:hypothetical protein